MTVAQLLPFEHEPRKSGPYQGHRSTLLSKERVRQLSKLRPYVAVRDTFWCWSCIVAAWAMVAAWPRWWLVLLSIPIIGSRFYALLIIGHDGLHRRLFRHRGRNDLFTDVFIMGAIGAVTRLNNRNHLRHHRHLASPSDPDRHKYCCFNKIFPRHLLNYLIGISSVWRSVANVFVRSASGVSGTASTSQSSKRSYTLRDVIILAGWQVALIGGLTWVIGIWAYPVLWLLPVYTFGFLADNLRSFLEHGSPEADARADQHRLITYESSWLERLFLAPMNMNYHAVHHLWPSIPYYNLPRANQEVREAPGAQCLEWRRSYIGFLWDYYRALPLLECSANVESPEHGAPAVHHNSPGKLSAPLIEMESVPVCPVCAGETSQPYAAGFDYELQTCSNLWQFVVCEWCGHVWLNPRPSLASLPIIYPQHYYAYNYEQINPVARHAKQWLDRMKLRSIERQRRRPLQSYLDIGCGNGRFLKLIEQRGVRRERLYGLELDERTVAQLVEDGYQVTCERVEQCDSILDSDLDLITMFHVIEHVHDPAAVIRKLSGWLAPGGVAAIETPNIDSVDARLFQDSCWGGYHIPRHWNLFTPESLARLLRENGLEVIEIRYQTGHAFWMYSLHHYFKYGSSLPQCLARLFDPFRNLPLLALFTGFDKLRALMGFQTSAMLMLARKPGKADSLE